MRRNYRRDPGAPRETQAEVMARWADHPEIMVREVFNAEPDKWQEKVLEAFPMQPRIAMQASKGVGKELDKETIIPTPQGDRRFGDLRTGDWVFAEDGSPTAVTAVFDNGTKPVWEVTFDDGASVKAGAEHLWKVRGATERSKKDFDWETCPNWAVLSTADIVVRGVRNKNGRWAGRQFEIPLHGAAQYATAELLLDPYLVGVWIGDGLRGQPSYFKPYPEIEQEIQRRGYETHRSGSKVRILGTIERLRSLECFDCLSPKRFIPQRFKEASAQQRRDLLCGLMDTDGCIGAEGSMEYATTSKRLALDVVWLVRSLGGNALVKDAIKEGWYLDDEGSRVDCRDCYRVTVRVPFNPFRIAHKAERWGDPMRCKSTARYMTRYIDRIEPAGVADCRCITVDHPSHCYLVNDFIVTHNTAVLVWLAWNFLLTRPSPKIVATSITGDNLSDNFWTEMSKWQQRSPLLTQMFQWTKTRIFNKTQPETWWMSARSWPKSGSKTEQENTLAGLHADYMLFILDESGGIPEAVMTTAEAALSTGIETHVIQSGNPTHLDGPLYRAATRDRKLWWVMEVNGDPENPDRSPRVSIEWARQMIASYGRDHPYVLVNVLGRFPPASMNSLIGPDDISAAQRRSYATRDFEAFARVMGVDVARFGGDKSVVFPRQGMVAFKPMMYRNIDGPQGAGIIARKWIDWDADAVFIDDTGGFGSSWIDNLRLLGRSPIGVHFSSEPNNARYVNKRAEMYFEAAEWIKNGGQLPGADVAGMAEFTAAMTTTTYTFRGDRFIIEPKDLIKDRLGYSPDEADAFILSFAQPMQLRRGYEPRSRGGGNVQRLPDYQPFQEFDLPGTGPQPW